jgi:hypothetical protein
VSKIGGLKLSKKVSAEVEFYKIDPCCRSSVGAMRSHRQSPSLQNGPSANLGTAISTNVSYNGRAVKTYTQIYFCAS